MASRMHFRKEEGPLAGAGNGKEICRERMRALTFSLVLKSASESLAGNNRGESR